MQTQYRRKNRNYMSTREALEKTHREFDEHNKHQCDCGRLNHLGMIIAMVLVAIITLAAITASILIEYFKHGGQ